MRPNHRTHIHAEFSKRSDAADAAALRAMRIARAAGITEKNLFADPGVAAAEAVRAAALKNLIGASIACGVTIFGDVPSEHNYWPCPKLKDQGDDFSDCA